MFVPRLVTKRAALWDACRYDTESFLSAFVYRYPPTPENNVFFFLVWPSHCHTLVPRVSFSDFSVSLANPLPYTRRNLFALRRLLTCKPFEVLWFVETYLIVTRLEQHTWARFKQTLRENVSIHHRYHSQVQEFIITVERHSGPKTQVRHNGKPMFCVCGLWFRGIYWVTHTALFPVRPDDGQVIGNEKGERRIIKIVTW